MKVALLNGSPKGSKSASQAILNFAQTVLPSSFTYETVELKNPLIKRELIEKIIGSQILIWAFPLYLDAIPSHLLPWLLELEKIYKTWQGEKPQVYALVNCGFYEPEQNQLLLAMLKHWSEKSGLTWGQGVGIGAGGVFNGLRNVPLGRWPFQKLANTLTCFAANVSAGKTSSDLYVSPDFPRFCYKLIAEIGWRRAIIRNGLRPRDLHRQIELKTIH